MAKRKYTSINSFLSYKYFDRLSRKYWQKRWKDKTGRETARGWNNSYEFRRYRSSIPGRIIKFAERRPKQFFDKAETVLRYSKFDFSFEDIYQKEKENVNEFLNPLSGAWGLTTLMRQIQARAILAGKKMLPIAKISMVPGLEPSVLNEDPTVITSIAESQRIREIVAKNYGDRVVKDKKEESYSLMGATYRLRTLVTSTQMLALFEMEIFYY